MLPGRKKCRFCEFTSTCNDLLLQHVVKKHRLEEDFTISCNKCFLSFTSMNSLKTHYYVKHHRTLQEDSSGVNTGGAPAGSSSHVSFTQSKPESYPDLSYEDAETSCISGMANVGSEFCESDSEDEMVCKTDGSFYFEVDDDDNGDDALETHQILEDCNKYLEGVESDELKWSSAKFLLHLREEGMISQSAVNKAVEGVDELFSSYSKVLKFRVMEGLDPTTQSVSKSHILETFAEFTSETLFSGLNTKKTLDSFIKSNCNILKPEAVELFRKTQWDDQGNMLEVPHNAYVSPFLPSLKRLISQPDILDCIENPFCGKDGLIRNYLDGSYRCHHPILSDAKALAIILCFDELEISSPLGPKKHKLGFYYWTLANIHPHLRSSIRAVNLLAVVWGKDLKQKKPLGECPSLDFKYESHCKILENFLSDIRTLENGITIQVNGSERQYKGSLLFVTGDSPAVGVMGGFKESVGPAHKPCHACHVTHDEMKFMFDEDMFEMRTMESHFEQLHSIQQAKTIKERERLSTLYGINGPSVISNLASFDYIKAFVYDLMHVIHEGVLEAHMRLLLDNCINVEQCLTIDQLNLGVRLIVNQIAISDKPASIDIGHLKSGLRQNAASMLNLALVLPLLLMKYPQVRERLVNFVLLLRIVNGLLSFELTVEDVSLLKKMIQKHHETFVVHYPHFDLPPKFHYIFHLPSQILTHGTSRVTWSMRFEAMHSYFKNIMRIIKNFKNPPWSLSYRYECLRCCQMLLSSGKDKKNYLDCDRVCYSIKTVKVEDHPQKLLLHQIFGSGDICLQTCAKIKSRGTLFSRDSIVLLDNSGTFGKILDIIVCNDISLFIVTVLKTLKFIPLCNAFQVSCVDEISTKIVFLENLQFHRWLPNIMLSPSDHFMYVLPKYHSLCFKYDVEPFLYENSFDRSIDEDCHL